MLLFEQAPDLLVTTIPLWGIVTIVGSATLAILKMYWNYYDFRTTNKEELAKMRETNKEEMAKVKKDIESIEINNLSLEREVRGEVGKMNDKIETIRKDIAVMSQKLDIYITSSEKTFELFAKQFKESEERTLEFYKKYGKILNP